MKAEWAPQSKYNPFNSMKGLTYYENYKAIVAWMAGKGKLPPPIECSLDPICRCNYDCYYCNSQRYLKYNKGEVPYGKKLSKAHMRDLVNFLANWGVRGLCLGGGGDSLLNPDAWDLPSYARGVMKVSVVTNGSMLTPRIIDNLLYCTWVGFSVDAGDRETFKRIHGVDMFYDVIANIKELCDRRDSSGSKVNVGFKVLILPENVDSLHKICKLAKSLGVKDFHLRPVDLERKDFKVKQKLNFDMPKILEQFDMCHEEETEDFRVFTVMHKYDMEFHVKHDFNACLASPLVIQCCTDGFAYVCVDHRMEFRFMLGTHSPELILNWWGSDGHRELLKSIKPHQECSRCTWSEYNRQIEEVVMENGMALSFP